MAHTCCTLALIPLSAGFARRPVPAHQGER